MNFKEVLKISITKSLLYVLLTTFITKLFYIIFNVQELGDAIYIELLFNQMYCILIFGSFLVLAYKSYQKTSSPSFMGLLTLTLLYVLISYFISWAIDFIFYHIHRLISTPKDENSTGIMSLMNFSPYHVNSLDLIQYFINTPYSSIVELLRSRNFSWALHIVSPPSFLIATLIIYFKSLYHIFKKENQKDYYALIPILNNVTLLKITNKPLWWIIPIHIPFIRLIPKLFINKILAKKYKKTDSFAYGMTLLPWFFYGKIGLKNDPS
ncbi:DUF5684 domain-containing protein [Aquimarina sediminis]|uniref:DUF5684 domain-containing protein n=1 Tax=Aquimarina sediminis TaxID=2070536 RepID=UPI000CA004FD|nr:DUF5684 domain-containing protein [Aquimarina sediminis]